MGAEHGCWACQRAVTDDGQGHQAEQREGDAAEKGREAEVDESRRVVVPVLLWVVVQEGGRAAGGTRLVCGRRWVVPVTGGGRHDGWRAREVGRRVLVGADDMVHEDETEGDDEEREPPRPPGHASTLAARARAVRGVRSSPVRVLMSAP